MSRSKEAHINDVLNLEAHCLADMARVRGLPGDSRASVTNLDRLFLICSSQDILSYSSLFCHTLVILFDASYSKGQNCPNVYDFLFSTRFLCQYFFWARQIGNKDSLAINVTMCKFHIDSSSLHLEINFLVATIIGCHGQTKQEREGEGKLWFIVNCRLRIEAREQGGLYTGAKGRPARSPAESERT